MIPEINDQILIQLADYGCEYFDNTIYYSHDLEVDVVDFESLDPYPKEIIRPNKTYLGTIKVDNKIEISLKDFLYLKERNSSCILNISPIIYDGNDDSAFIYIFRSEVTKDTNEFVEFAHMAFQYSLIKEGKHFILGEYIDMTAENPKLKKH